MKSIIFIILSSVSFSLWAQEGNVAAGGEYSGIGGTMSNSTGQIDFSTLESANVSIQFGLQQVFFDVPQVPADNILQNIVIAESDNNCFNATQTITTGGEETTFIVESGGNVELIAGQNIIMLPGTHVLTGGNLLARISADGFYCDGIQSFIVESQNTKTQLIELFDDMNITSKDVFDSNYGNTSFKIYPNPTPGLFTVEITGVDLQEKTSVTIYGVRGERIQQSEVKGSQFSVFSLEKQRPGIYFIQILNNKMVGAKRIIKQ
jgi:hypothetical protein